MSKFHFVVVAFVFAILLVGCMAPGGGYIDSKKSQYEDSVDRANDVACKANLQQVRAAIAVYKSEHDEFPESLDDLELSKEESSYCPVSEEMYEYDSSTGEVYCTTKGHEDF